MTEDLKEESIRNLGTMLERLWESSDGAKLEELREDMEGVLALHRPVHNGYERFCSECRDAAWPCNTVEALIRRRR